ncbi:M48 family metallopeptidase [Ancylobacter amanitiformis]|uniref:Metal-dependent hydrolase n=1 Tax=Ancylobacter amanitiformis TaxID=217069 RepID=A0ABU0LTC1_9HYPH|nr:SprT family zinc-dependent metalloprotease [Ancylobacter amanitiformis]MDQ0511947.1 putative metal-dependent hydrolase [Ancylobacter amanitiformis]
MLFLPPLFSRPGAPKKATPTSRIAPPAEPAEFRLDVDGEPILIALRRNPRARRYTLRVRAATRDVVLTLPARGTINEAYDFARRHVGWIRVRLAKLPQTVAFVPGAVIPLRGTPHRILHRPGARGTVWTGVEDGAPVLYVAGEAAHVGRRIGDFLKREARGALTEAARRHALALGVSIARVTLRDTASRWGSCSSAGALSFSWRLILAPGFVLDYLAAHEVAHRREMNHGPRFWAHVDRLFPERMAAEAWLKKHGAELHRYGADEG